MLAAQAPTTCCIWLAIVAASPAAAEAAAAMPALLLSLLPLGQRWGAGCGDCGDVTDAAPRLLTTLPSPTLLRVAKWCRVCRGGSASAEVVRALPAAAATSSESQALPQWGASRHRMTCRRGWRGGEGGRRQDAPICEH